MAAALATAASAAPAAQAYHAPAEHTTTATTPVSVGEGHSRAGQVWRAKGREIDRLGPKYVPLEHAIDPAPVTVVKAVRPVGFDWGDAGIGAAAASLTLALVAATALLITRRHRDKTPHPALVSD